MNDRAKPENEAKLPYKAPQVSRVSLRAEEAVLGHCKFSSSTAPVGGGCAGPTRCKVPGS